MSGGRHRPGAVVLRLRSRSPSVKVMFVIIAWFLLFVLCWPLAILALVLWPFLWLLSLPFRLVGITFEALFALLRAVLFLPARALGYRQTSARHW